jgi:hypothetical protein
MTNLGAILNPAGQKLYRQAVRKKIRELLDDPLINGPERKAGYLKLEEPEVPLETLEKRRDKLVEIISDRRLAPLLKA